MCILNLNIDIEYSITQVFLLFLCLFMYFNCRIAYQLGWFPDYYPMWEHILRLTGAVGSLFVRQRALLYITWAVTHPSTDWTQCCLIQVIEGTQALQLSQQDKTGPVLKIKSYSNSWYWGLSVLQRTAFASQTVPHPFAKVILAVWYWKKGFSLKMSHLHEFLRHGCITSSLIHCNIVCKHALPDSWHAILMIRFHYYQVFSKMLFFVVFDAFLPIKSIKKSLLVTAIHIKIVFHWSAHAILTIWGIFGPIWTPGKNRPKIIDFDPVMTTYNSGHVSHT